MPQDDKAEQTTLESLRWDFAGDKRPVSGRQREQWEHSGLAKGRRRRWLSLLSWVATASILSLLFMPLQNGLAVGGDWGDAFALPCSVAHPKGPEQPGPIGHPHGGCPFCVAHAGYSPPPPPTPDLAIVPRLLPVALSWPIPEQRGSIRYFLISPQSRAPPPPRMPSSPISGCFGAEGRYPV